MKKLAVILMFVLSANLFSQSTNESAENNEEVSKIPEQLLAIVTSIIQDDDSLHYDNISTGAYFIDDKADNSQYDILTGKNMKKYLLESKDTEVKYLHMRIPDDYNSAFMVIRTESKLNGKLNWHTVSFELKDDKIWQIVGWHKS